MQEGSKNSGDAGKRRDARVERAMNGWEEARRANLMHLASLTPAQRVEWLGWAFDFWVALQRSRKAGSQ